MIPTQRAGRHRSRGARSESEAPGEVGERWLIGAEVAAHLAAALAGATAVRSGIPIAAVFPATWIVAFALDFGLGRAAVRLYGRTLSRADEG